MHGRRGRRSRRHESSAPGQCSTGSCWRPCSVLHRLVLEAAFRRNCEMRAAKGKELEKAPEL